MKPSVCISIGVLPTKAAGYQDVRQVVGVALMMEIVWKSPEEKLAIGLIYCQNQVVLFFVRKTISSLSQRKVR